MDAETLDMFRSVHNADTLTLEALKALAHDAAQLRAAMSTLYAELAETRDEIVAVANRVESLTRAMQENGYLHSVKVEPQ